MLLVTSSGISTGMVKKKTPGSVLSVAELWGPDSEGTSGNRGAVLAGALDLR